MYYITIQCIIESFVNHIQTTILYTNKLNSKIFLFFTDIYFDHQRNHNGG